MIRVSLMLLALCNQLIMTKQILNSFLLSTEFILQNFNFGLKFNIILFDLVIEDFHLDGLLIELLLLFGG